MAEAFESDEQFLDYVVSHSQTPRALFHRDHVMRFLRLAGIYGEAYQIEKFPQDFYPMHWPDIEPTMKLARQTLKKPKPTAKIIPFPVRRRF